jgi:hypothetical protein
MLIKTWPYYWNSAHRPIIIEYDYESEVIATNADNGGNARITVSSAWDENSSQAPVVGDFLIFPTGHAYAGRQEVLTVHSATDFTIDIAYNAGAATGGNVQFERRPEIELYKGYNTGEEYDTELPLTLVASFTPRNSPNNDISIDLSGYLRHIFTIENPISSPSTDFTMFNRFRLKFDGSLQEVYHVVNSAIESEELNEKFVDSGRYLVNEQYPYVMGCGNGTLTKITDAEVVNVVGDLLTIITTP